MISHDFSLFPLISHVRPCPTYRNYSQTHRRASWAERPHEAKEHANLLWMRWVLWFNHATCKKQDKTLKHFVLNIEFPLPSTNFYSMNHVSKGELQTVLPRPKSQSIPQNISTTCWLAVITHLTFIFPFGIFPVIQGQLANIRHVHLVVQTLDTYVHISYYSIQYTYKMCWKAPTSLSFPHLHLKHRIRRCRNSAMANPVQIFLHAGQSLAQKIGATMSWARQLRADLGVDNVDQCQSMCCNQC